MNGLEFAKLINEKFVELEIDARCAYCLDGSLEFWTESREGHDFVSIGFHPGTPEEVYYRDMAKKLDWFCKHTWERLMTSPVREITFAEDTE